MDGMQQLDQTPLPPNWECRFDSRTGRYYFVNLFTKSTTWDDPRARFRTAQLSSESIPLQQMHASPYHVYPASNSFYPAQTAFQNPPSGVPSVQSNNSSPQFNLKRQQIEMSPIIRSTPHTPRSQSRSVAPRKSMQETSFSSQLQETDPEVVVSKINTMFPTVPETHIRMLLKKYYNREAVVISALQVEKHPITTPGPYTPPPIRNFHAAATAATAVAAFQKTPPSFHRGSSTVGINYSHYNDTISSRNASPVTRPASVASTAPTVSMSMVATHGGGGISCGSPRFEGGFRMSPKPHSSPKMKLRYVKGLFPKAEETVILDVLANVDNNVQKASDRLVQMGYQKRDVVAANKALLQKKVVEQQEREEKLLLTPKPVRIKTMDEKRKIRQKLQTQFVDIPERVVLMALESVEYSEERAMQILNIVMQEDNPEPKTVSIDEIKQESETENNEHLSRSSSSASKPDVSSKVPHSSHHQLTTGSGMRKTESSATTALMSGESRSSSHYHLGATAETSSSSEIYSSSLESSPDEKHFARSRLPKAQLYHFKTSTQISGRKNEKAKGSDVVDNDADYLDETFKAVHISSYAKGPNPNIRKGPNDELLLSDYMTWNGANPDLSTGKKTHVRGPDKGLLGERAYVPRGSKKELCKGSSTLAQGSMYSQLNRPDVVCN